MKNRLRCGRGGVSPAGEVLSSDGKYPKITGAAAPDPGEPFGGEAGFRLDRRGCRLVVVLTFPARCRSASVSVSLYHPLFRSAPGMAAIAGCVLWCVVGGAVDCDHGDGSCDYPITRKPGCRGRCPHRPVSGVRRSSRDAEDSVPYERALSIYRKGSRPFNPPHPARRAGHLPSCGWKARAKPSPWKGADSPCQGEMSRSDKRGREGAPVLTLGRMRGTPYKRLQPKGLQTPNSYLLTPNSQNSAFPSHSATSLRGKVRKIISTAASYSAEPWALRICLNSLSPPTNRRRR